MTAQRVYARGNEFPNEGFVQAAIENYFKNKGYELEIDKFADLVCVHPNEKNRWVIEAKGLSKHWNRLSDRVRPTLAKDD